MYVFNDVNNFYFCIDIVVVVGTRTHDWQTVYVDGAWHGEVGLL